MRAYVINLPSSIDRRQRLERQLASARIDYELVEAVDGRELTAEQRAELVDEEEVRRYPHWLTAPAIGCTLSHRRVYERIVSSGEAAGLVLEDDAVLPARFGELLDQLATELQPLEVILLYFRSFAPCRLTSVGAVDIGERRLLRPLDPRQAISALAYLVGLDAAASLAASTVPVSLAADSWGERLARGAINSLRLLYPPPVGHNPTFESSGEYDAPIGMLRATKDLHLWPVPQLRAANRRRVDRKMSRVEIVNAGTAPSAGAVNG